MHTGANLRSVGQLHPALHSFIKVNGLQREIYIWLFFFLISLNNLLSDDGGAVHDVVGAADENEKYFCDHVEHAGDHVPEQNDSGPRLEF